MYGIVGVITPHIPIWWKGLFIQKCISRQHYLWGLSQKWLHGQLPISMLSFLLSLSFGLPFSVFSCRLPTPQPVRPSLRGQTASDKAAGDHGTPLIWTEVFSPDLCPDKPMSFLCLRGDLCIYFIYCYNELLHCMVPFGCVFSCPRLLVFCTQDPPCLWIISSTGPCS